jgi:hypothetical protein
MSFALSNPVSYPLLFVVIAWGTSLFCGFGLMSRGNPMTVIVLAFGALASLFGVFYCFTHSANKCCRTWAKGSDNRRPTLSQGRGHCQSKFYTACSRTRAGWSSTVFAHELPPVFGRIRRRKSPILICLDSAPNSTLPLARLR